MQSPCASSTDGTSGSPVQTWPGPAPVVELLRDFPIRAEDPVCGRQATGGVDASGVFHVLMEALLHPGRIALLPTPLHVDGYRVPAMSWGSVPPTRCFDLLCRLMSPGDPLWLGRGQPRELAALRAGCCAPAPLVADPGCARFALTRAAETPASLWHALGQRRGAEASLAAATLLIEVPLLINDPPPPREEPTDRELTPRLTVTLPQRRCYEVQLAVGGLGRHFWRARSARRSAGEAGGVDLLLVCGAQVAAIPYTAEVALVA